jgi:RNA polymerase sigma factor (sigma-70 family)
MSAESHELERLRTASFAIAYRMLGSVSEAEDVVQEALLRVHQAIERGEQITSPRAYIATVTTRLAINELRSARVRREQYVGDWLPEPILTDGRDDPAQHAEMADSLSLAMLVLLESLSPEQRAALLLHDVFDYPFPEIADGEIRSIRSVVNPDKLAHLGVVGDFASLLARHRASADTSVDSQTHARNRGGTA